MGTILSVIQVVRSYTELYHLMLSIAEWIWSSRNPRKNSTLFGSMIDDEDIRELQQNYCRIVQDKKYLINYFGKKCPRSGGDRIKQFFYTLGEMFIRRNKKWGDITSLLLLALAIVSIVGYASLRPAIQGLLDVIFIFEQVTPLVAPEKYFHGIYCSWSCHKQRMGTIIQAVVNEDMLWDSSLFLLNFQPKQHLIRQCHRIMTDKDTDDLKNAFLLVKVTYRDVIRDFANKCLKSGDQFFKNLVMVIEDKQKWSDIAFLYLLILGIVCLVGNNALNPAIETLRYRIATVRRPRTPTVRSTWPPQLLPNWSI